MIRVYSFLDRFLYSIGLIKLSAPFHLKVCDQCRMRKEGRWLS